MVVPGRYVKRPVQVEAVRWQPEYRAEAIRIVDWMVYAGASFRTEGMGADAQIVISTLEGEMTVQPGDWIVRGTAGEFYPCKPHVFLDVYLLAGDAV